MSEIPSKIFLRYWTAGAVHHHATCSYASLYVCTCGLLDDLARGGADVYPNYWRERELHDQALRRILADCGD